MYAQKIFSAHYFSQSNVKSHQTFGIKMSFLLSLKVGFFILAATFSGFKSCFSFGIFQQVLIAFVLGLHTNGIFRMFPFILQL